MNTINMRNKNEVENSGMAAPTPAMILNVGRAHGLLLRVRTQVLRSAGFRVIEETSASRAVRVAREKKVDLVLLCHTIPVSDLEWTIAGISRLDSAPSIAFVAPFEERAVPDGICKISCDARDLVLEVRGILDGIASRFAAPKPDL